MVLGDITKQTEQAESKPSKQASPIAFASVAASRSRP